MELISVSNTNEHSVDASELKYRNYTTSNEAIQTDGDMIKVQGGLNFDVDCKIGTLIEILVYDQETDKEIWKPGYVDNYEMTIKGRFMHVKLKNKNNKKIVKKLNIKNFPNKVRLRLYGESPDNIPCIVVPKISNGIPKILIQLSDVLFRTKGHLLEGIIRVEPDKNDVEVYRTIIAQNKIDLYDYKAFNPHIAGMKICVY